MSFAGYFLSVLFCLLSMLISDSRFDLVWFRLSCDHGWIRSGSVNVRKQQQQPETLRQALPLRGFLHRVSQLIECALAGASKSSGNVIVPHRSSWSEVSCEARSAVKPVAVDRARADG